MGTPQIAVLLAPAAADDVLATLMYGRQRRRVDARPHADVAGGN